MEHVRNTTIDLARLSLAAGEGRRLQVPIALGRLVLGAEEYRPSPDEPRASLEVSRPTSGYAMRLRFEVALEGPCTRCLAPARLELAVDAREVDQPLALDDELRSPYVVDEVLEVGRWAHDAALLALPARLLCRPDCAGLCPVCGETLNGADPDEHRHAPAVDPRWAKLGELELE